MALTRAQKKRYLRKDGNVCPNPHCNSEDLRTIGQPNIDGKCIRQDIECLNCGQLWTNLYILSDITE